MNAMLPAHLSETLNNLGDLARALTVEVHAEAEVTRRHNRRVTALLAVVALLVGGLVWLSLSNRRLGMANADLNKQNSQIVEQIRSCTTVGGACYEQGQRRTGDVAGELIRANIYIQLCLRDHPDSDEAQVEACVQKQRAAAVKPRPSPAPTS
jgi:hypothetical protein